MYFCYNLCVFMPIERWRNKEGKIEKEREREKDSHFHPSYTLSILSCFRGGLYAFKRTHTHTLNAYTDAGLFRLQLTQICALRWFQRNCVQMHIKVF